MKKLIYIALFAVAAAGCSIFGENDKPDAGDNITLSFNVNNYVRNQPFKSALLTADDEQAIENLYFFLFPVSGGAAPATYAVEAADFTGGVWNESENRISLSLTRAEAGERNVFIVVNYPAEMKAQLDAVSDAEALKAVLQSTENPWSDNLSTPILMSGSATHNFNDSRTLNSVPLTRAIAKIELNVSLSEAFRSAVTNAEGEAQYRYRYVDFDKATYAVKPAAKADNLTTSEWTDWAEANITQSGGKATGLELTTYLNERDTKGAKVEIQLYYNDGGLLPPPEFGPETYILPLPDKIERNHWYVFDIEI